MTISIFGDLRPQIQRNWGRSDTESQSTILFYFNAAMRMIARKHRFAELEKTATPTLVIDKSEYDIATDWSLTDYRKMYSLYLTANDRGYEVVRVPTKEWDQEIWPRIPNATSDVPRVYHEWGSKITLFPAPNVAYVTKMRYLGEPTPCTVVGSSVIFSGLDEVLVELTTGLCFMSIEDYVVAKQHLDLASKFLKLYGVEAEFSKDLHLSAGKSPSSASQYWKDPFVGRSP